MNRLEQLLEDSGMTRYELTKQMGIRPGSLDRYFNGKASMITMSRFSLITESPAAWDPPSATAFVAAGAAVAELPPPEL